MISKTDTPFRKKEVILLLTISLSLLAFFLTKSYLSVNKTKTVQTTSPSLTDTTGNDSLPSQIPDNQRLDGKTSDGGVMFVVSDLNIKFIIPSSVNKGNLYLGKSLYPAETYNSMLCISTDPNPLRFNSQCYTESFAITAMTTKGSHFEREEKFLDDIKRYFKKDGKYYGQYGENSNLQIEVKDLNEVKSPSGIEILKMKGEDIILKTRGVSRPAPGTPGKGYIGAIVNLPNNPTYSGFTIKMKLTPTLTEKVFDQILDSIKITE